jgi:hypothetical protein
MQESVLDEMTHSVQVFVVFALHYAILSRRDDGAHPLCLSLRDDGIAVVAFVSQ